MTQESANSTCFQPLHVLVCCIAGNSELEISDIAQLVGITERAVAVIIGDLEDGGYLKRVKQGRRNTYVLNKKAELFFPPSA